MRSKLFVPCSRPELFAKALAGPADAISFDLEDSVLHERKEYARRELTAFLSSDLAGQTKKKIIVRVNGLDTEYLAEDLKVAVHPNVDVVNVPKIDTKKDVLTFMALLSKAQTEYQPQTGTLSSNVANISVLANIETAKALRNAADIAAAHAKVWGLQLGLGDLFEPLNVARYDAQNIHAAMFALRMAAAESNCVVYDTAYADVANANGFRQEALLARNLGFLGKTCIHPSQVAVANEVFSPTEAEIEWARKVVAAAAENDVNGAYMLEGKMIDAPFVVRAQLIINLAQNQPEN